MFILNIEKKNAYFYFIFYLFYKLNLYLTYPIRYATLEYQNYTKNLYVIFHF